MPVFCMLHIILLGIRGLSIKYVTSYNVIKEFTRHINISIDRATEMIFILKSDKVRLLGSYRIIFISARHCEERSNPQLVDPLCIVWDCFVPRNDAR